MWMDHKRHHEALRGIQEDPERPARGSKMNEKLSWKLSNQHVYPSYQLGRLQEAPKGAARVLYECPKSTPTSRLLSLQASSGRLGQGRDGQTNRSSQSFNTYESTQETRETRASIDEAIASTLRWRLGWSKTQSTSQSTLPLIFVLDDRTDKQRSLLQFLYFIAANVQHLHKESPEARAKSKGAAPLADHPSSSRPLAL